MTAFTVALDDVAAGDLALVGGKAANLGELLRAGFRVPPGFCVTTAAFQRFIASAGDDVLAPLDDLDGDDEQALRSAGQAVRSRLSAVGLPDAVAEAVVAAWTALGADEAYAVRSSATAEDLPTASFAGQQDTYLNVRGRAALLERVRDCCCSLFTDRAIDYRVRRGIDHRSVALAVVVQRMVEPVASGILFTADPVSGHRRIAAIDASLGLGEATVSGIVSADAISVDTRTGRIVATRIADKAVAVEPLPEGGTRQVDVAPQRRGRPTLRDDQALELARLGSRIEAHYGTPQDVEWALTADGSVIVLQARPITTLFPLPAPRPDDGLHVYVSFGHVQAMTDAMPPMARSLWRVMLPIGRSGPHGLSRHMAEAGSRLYVDGSRALRHPVLRRALPRLVRVADHLAAAALAEVVSRPEFRSTGARARLGRPLRVAAPILAGAARVAVFSTPEGTADRMAALIDDRIAGVEAALAVAPDLRRRLDVCDAELRTLFELPRRWIPHMLVGMVAGALVRPFVGDGDPGDLSAVGRGLYGNVATEMDLAVADLADLVRSAEMLDVLDRTGEPAASRLAAIADLDGGRTFLAAWDEFLTRYGARCNGEVDASRPRWSEESGALLQMVRSAAAQGEPGSTRARYQALHEEGVAAEGRLVAATRTGRLGRLRGPLVRRLLRLQRALLPLRDHHKLLLVRLLMLVRVQILEAGRQLRASGRLTDPDDVWLLTWPELLSALDDPDVDVAPLVVPRRSALERDRALTPPRLITSDGEIVTVSADVDAPDGALVGSPVSAGVVEGTANVVLDPRTASLAPGDILVAPFTDPGWTPLFVSAAGLVTEVGGLMTHGSVVAREYGIPAVVGVADATRAIRTGQRLRVHGDVGYVEVLDGERADAERPAAAAESTP